MRVGGYVPAAAWMSLQLAQQALVQAASQASGSAAQPAPPPDPLEGTPASRPLNTGNLDIQV